MFGDSGFTVAFVFMVRVAVCFEELVGCYGLGCLTLLRFVDVEFWIFYFEIFSS